MKSNNINIAIDKLVELAPIILFVVLFLVLFLTGYLQSHFYSSIFKGLLPTEYMAVLFPVVVQTLRLVTGFLSSSFFKKKRIAAGITVFIFSLWLTMFEHNEAKSMGEYFVSLNIDLSTLTQTEAIVSLTKEIITDVVHILIWGALFLEFFLAIWLSQSEASNNEQTASINFSENGARKKPQTATV